jgi:hypothetical protein
MRVLTPELLALADPDAQRALEAEAYAFADRFGVPVVVESLVPPDELPGALEAFRTIQMFEAWTIHGAWIRSHPGALGGGIAARFTAASKVIRAETDDAHARRRAFQVRFARALGEGRYLLHLQPVGQRRRSISPVRPRMHCGAGP